MLKFADKPKLTKRAARKKVAEAQTIDDLPSFTDMAYIIPLKKQVTLRLDEDVIAHFRAGGPGWQTRMNDVLRRAMK